MLKKLFSPTIDQIPPLALLGSSSSLCCQFALEVQLTVSLYLVFTFFLYSLNMKRSQINPKFQCQRIIQILMAEEFHICFDNANRLLQSIAFQRFTWCVCVWTFFLEPFGHFLFYPTLALKLFYIWYHIIFFAGWGDLIFNGVVPGGQAGSYPQRPIQDTLQRIVGSSGECWWEGCLPTARTEDWPVSQQRVRNSFFFIFFLHFQEPASSFLQSPSLPLAAIVVRCSIGWP